MARQLFKDLDSFSHDDYKPLANITERKSRIIEFHQAAVLSNWLVHTFRGSSEKGTHLIPIAVDLEGKGVASLEKHNRECFKAPAGRVLLDEDERAQLLHEHIEPTLQRELGYRGVANPDTGYATELLAWVEIE